MKNIKKAGISLVALAVTIIVLIILTGAAILTFMDGGIIDRAKEAVFRHDISVMQEQIMIRNNEIKLSKYSDKKYEEGDYSGIVDEKYKERFVITKEGNLTYTGSDEKELKITREMGLVVDDLISNLEKLYNLAVSYREESGTATSATQLSLQYIRRNRYSGGNWDTTAGTIDSGFVTYASSKLTYNFDNATIPGTGVDFVHMCATLNANIYSATFLADYAGWAGDLVTLMGEVINEDKNSTSTEIDDELYAFAKQKMGAKTGSTFSLEDVIGDVDAINIYKAGTDNLYEAIYNYYYVNTDTREEKNAKFIYYVFGLEKGNYENNISSKIVTKFSGFIEDMAITRLLSSSQQAKYTGSYKTKYRTIAAKVFEEYFIQNT